MARKRKASKKWDTDFLGLNKRRKRANTKLALFPYIYHAIDGRTLSQWYPSRSPASLQSSHLIIFPLRAERGTGAERGRNRVAEVIRTQIDNSQPSLNFSYKLRFLA